MSKTLTGKLDATVSWTYKNDHQDAGGSTSERSKHAIAANINSGNGLTTTNGVPEAQVDIMHRSRYEIDADTALDLQLDNASLADVFGAALTFARLRTLQIENLSAANSVTVSQVSTGADFDGPFSAGVIEETHDPTAVSMGAGTDGILTGTAADLAEAGGGVVTVTAPEGNSETGVSLNVEIQVTPDLEPTSVLIRASTDNSQGSPFLWVYDWVSESWDQGPVIESSSLTDYTITLNPEHISSTGLVKVSTAAQAALDGEVLVFDHVELTTVKGPGCVLKPGGVMTMHCPEGWVVTAGSKFRLTFGSETGSVQVSMLGNSSLT